jgi:hypothetical protein
MLKLSIKAFAFVLSLSVAALAQGDPLPSWNNGAVKQRIIGFVDKVTSDGGADFVPPAERIAVFDNDGTLWAEQPVYFQVQFGPMTAPLRSGNWIRRSMRLVRITGQSST